MITTQPADWDATVDVVVVGSGGAALTAAVLASDGGAEVLVLEKDTVLGGTTGVSGGVLWIPGNHHLPEAGFEDSREDAIAYIRRIADGRELDPSLVEVFVDTAPEMLQYLESNTPLKMQPLKILPDYYLSATDIPGMRPPGRSVEPLPFAVRAELPEWADRLAARSTLLSLGATTTLNEDLAAMGGMSEENRDELARREREGVRTKGAALIGTLVKALVDRGVEIRTATPVAELVMVDGAVVGVRSESDGQSLFIGARKAVILACGGFEWNEEMVRECIGYEVKPLSPGTNTGDGHIMAMEAGARMGLMASYWGQGAMFDPSITRDDGSVAGQMSSGVPGGVIVNRQGRTFMSGGFTYNDWPKPFGTFDQDHPGYPNRPPGWTVFDQSVKDQFAILTVRPEDPAPDWFHRGETIEELAASIAVDAEALAESAAGLSSPPFYALELWPASLGTNGGCRIDANGQVLGYRAEVIPGLYAAGNTSAAVLGGAYVGAGTPMGSGCTFGYRAGRHAAEQPTREIGE